MVVTIKSLSSASASASGSYFYMTERNYECEKGWYQNTNAAKLNCEELARDQFEEILNGKIGNIQLGRKTKDGIKHHCGQELIFSAPKSVSIMGLVLEDQRVLRAHEQAVDGVLGYIERNMIYTRVQHEGNLKFERTDNIVAAKFTHLTSRPLKDNEDNIKPDPQLHTHALIANATLCTDGKWRSVVFDRLYENKMHLGELYRMELAYNLERLGYEVVITADKTQHWLFEIAGVPKSYIEAFSNRRHDILAMAAEHGVHDAESLAYIAKMTRGEKINFSEDELKSDWKSRVELSLLAALSKQERQAEMPTGLCKEAIEYAVLNCTEREAVFSKEALIAGMLRKTRSVCNIKALESALQDHELIKSYNVHSNNFTTAMNLKLEQANVALLQKLQNTVKVIMQKGEIASYLKNTNLSTEQKDAVYLSFNSKDRVVGIQGVAGAGKTTVVEFIKELAAQQGYSVVGLAPTASAADTMSSAIGIHAKTLKSFLVKYQGVLAGRGTEKGRIEIRRLFQDKMIFIDEASFISSGQMHDLLVLTDILQLRVILMGDVHQLASIEAGKPFHYLQEHGMDTVVLKNSVRQKNTKLLLAVNEAAKLVDSKPSAASKILAHGLGLLKAEHLIELNKANDRQVTTTEYVEAAYTEWLEHFNKKLETLVIVPSHNIRKALNAKIRMHFVQENGREHQIFISKSMTRAAMAESVNYQVGDVLSFHREVKHYETKAMEYWEVVGVDGDAITVWNKTQRLLIDAAGLKKINNAVNVYSRETINLSAGDRLKWTKNSKARSFIVNGMSAVVDSVHAHHIELKLPSGEVAKMSLNDPELRHIDYDYVHTIYGAQGKTVDYVVGVLRGKEQYIPLSTQRSFYVTLSRARHGAQIITDNTASLLLRLSHQTGAKTSAIETMREEKEKSFPVNLDKQGREAIDDKTDSVKHSAVTRNDKIDSIKHSAIAGKNMPIYHFDAALVSRVASERFGEINMQLSKHDRLRFGRHGKIAVELSTGRWYDFSTGEGGSLYKEYQAYDKPSHQYKTIQTSTANQNAEAVAAKKTQQMILKTVERTIPLEEREAKMSRRYFADHRKIDLQQINLSHDIRFCRSFYSSEIKNGKPAIVAVARNSAGDVQAIQGIYLQHDSNKDATLQIKKRTMGTLKGSFVELTKNIMTDKVLIAEGLETALSVAQANPAARVICSLGIANMRNIDLTGKDVVICADNDGHNAHTHDIIDNTAATLRDNGARSVQVIRPKGVGEDFNDVLKKHGLAELKQYFTQEKAVKHDEIIKLHEQIQQHIKEEHEYHEKVLDGVYVDRTAALANWQHLVATHGIEKAEDQVKIKPSLLGRMKGIGILGFENDQRKNANENLLPHLAMMKQMHHKQQVVQEKKGLMLPLMQDYNTSLRQTIDIDTKDANNYIEVQKLLVGGVTKALNNDGIYEHQAVQDAVHSMSEQVLYYRQRYQKEASFDEKKEFYLRAKFEAVRKPILKSYLEQQIHCKTAGDLLDFAHTLERFVHIASKMATREDIHMTPVTLDESYAVLQNNDKKIAQLQKDYVVKGFSEIKGLFIAKEIVCHEERYGNHSTLRQYKTLCDIGDYVHHNFQELQRHGFTKQEARIAMTEGHQLTYEDIHHNFAITKPEIQAVQSHSKQTITQIRRAAESIEI